MKITDFFSLLGGLAFFLYGRQMRSNGLEAAAGNRMKQIIEKLTSNRFLGVLVGSGITALIQSSSASVGILQALASSGLIGLPNAVFVLFGQNIGTCITAVLAAIGTSRNAKRTISLLGGLALFLYGMQMMSNGLEAAAGNRMKQILEKLTANRFLGVLVGSGITAVIQSSSATTVMVVGFVNSGMMTLKQAVLIIMGSNFGTTIK